MMMTKDTNPHKITPEPPTAPAAAPVAVPAAEPLTEAVPKVTDPDRRALDEYLFHQGTARHAYTYLGAHTERDRVVFRVWAPHARETAVVGSFCGWDAGLPMQKITDAGLYLLSVPSADVPDGSLYKYRITGRDGQVYYKADPYGQSMECPPTTATVFRAPSAQPFEWHDKGWLAQRRKRAESGRQYPFNIYEIHAGSWKRREDGSPLSYRELGDQLAPYLKQMGYTHVELMPIMEHPFDGSWGYQVGGYYAPTARYGSPDEFRGFVDIMHEAGIGVILDWVPAHFPKDAFGLYRFDGEPTYEYEDPTRQENRGWGTCCFDVGRTEVKSFLISNAYYWVEEFHADGLRVDAVASMLYLNYDRQDGEWMPNKYGGIGNLESVSFLQHLNHSLHDDHPDVLTIAEESTMWPHITTFDDYGLGFSYKWNMGWMNDTLRYAGTDPLFRKHLHGQITHTADYAFDERYVLPISHDEVVHLKKSYLDKMPGDYGMKFAGARLFAAFMMTFPGGKLWFMGAEIGQFTEWDEKKSVEWFLLDYESHARLQHYFACLNNFYLEHPALWDVDPNDPLSSFVWEMRDDAEDSILAYRRVSADGRQLVAVLNFTPVPRLGHLITVTENGTYREVFNSDDKRFGGDGMINQGDLCARSRYLMMNIPAMGCVILEQSDKAQKPRTTAARRTSRPAAAPQMPPPVCRDTEAGSKTDNKGSP